jgi:hypothetical protein
MVPEPVLRVKMNTSWQLVEAFHKFLAAFAPRVFSARVAGRICTASHELLEEAVNFCSINTDIEYELHHVPDRQAVEVRVTHALAPARVQLLLRKIAEMEAKRPDRAYEEALRAVSAGSLYHGTLGLARIRFEAEMSLEASVTGERVTVIARGRD